MFLPCIRFQTTVSSVPRAREIIESIADNYGYLGGKGYEDKKTGNIRLQLFFGLWAGLPEFVTSDKCDPVDVPEDQLQSFGFRPWIIEEVASGHVPRSEWRPGKSIKSPEDHAAAAMQLLAMGVYLVDNWKTVKLPKMTSIATNALRTFWAMRNSAYQIGEHGIGHAGDSEIATPALRDRLMNIVLVPNRLSPASDRQQQPELAEV